MKQMIIYSGLCIALLIMCCNKKKGNDDTATSAVLKDSILTSKLSHPWEIVWGPDNFIWMTERGGKLSRVNPATGAVTTILTIAEVSAQGEGGLLGMALHPNFATTPQVFVAYDYMNGSTYIEKIVRYTYNGSTLTSPQIIIDNIKAASIHNGCRLLITPDQKLFITTGDSNDQTLPQNKSALNGKVLRLNLDGSIPADNPTPGSAVWSFGHRNPQGLVFANNILYSSEHGPSSDDEINIIEKGRNYGWPTVMGFCNTSAEQSFCNANNVREPLWAWTPTIAPSGLDYYDKDQIPQWKHSLLLAVLKDSRLLQLKLNAARTGIDSVFEFYVNKYGRMRDVCISPEGKVYVCTDNGDDDKIVEVKKK
ncbi:glucose dehydrogenase [Niastella vici]|uniref:Glucose dehydrogenase n=1 Tax=Niastella vici TaxID=1703345 RepID=A0A1V9G0X1_9BACT|nr:PQQ-dependent sugar dehydrogenase [Niastella vici]OQP64214.1 glucose dehydrogenase [Niastella vici]